VLIYVCLSSHGFGHAARQAAVLAELHALAPEVRLVLSSAVDAAFLDLVLEGLPVERRQIRWDVGMVQSDALGTDPGRTLAALETLSRDLPRRLDREAAWLTSQQDEVLIVGDIPPAAAELSRRLQVPLVWMANFGWDEIYEPLGGAFLDHSRTAADAYRQGDLLIRCPFSLPMPWGIPEQPVGLTASRPRPLPDDFQARLDADQRPRIFVGFGGLGFSLDPELFSRWPDHCFLLSPPPQPEQVRTLEGCANVVILPPGVRPLDVLPFCERHLGKPGYSSFCEALSSDIGLHVVERSGFAEASALIAGLRRHGHHRLITRNDLEVGAWQLNEPLKPPSSAPLPPDGVASAAKAILSRLSRG